MSNSKFHWDIDDREDALYKYIKITEIPFEKKRLTSGDLLLWRETECILWIERKELGDFWASIKDGRYAWQKYHAFEWRQKYPNCRIFWLVEGNWSQFSDEIQIRIRSVLWKLMLRNQCFIWWSSGVESTAQTILQLSHQVNQEQEEWNTIFSIGNLLPMPPEENPNIAATRTNRKSNNAEETWQRMLMTIPGVTNEVAQEFCKDYSNAKDWIQACSQTDLDLLHHNIATKIHPSGSKRKWGPQLATRLITFFGFSYQKK